MLFETLVDNAKHVIATCQYGSIDKIKDLCGLALSLSLSRAFDSPVSAVMEVHN